MKAGLFKLYLEFLFGPAQQLTCFPNQSAEFPIDPMVLLEFFNLAANSFRGQFVSSDANSNLSLFPAKSQTEIRLAV